jgi:tetratricopeptide (TPR) repeat protein
MAIKSNPLFLLLRAIILFCLLMSPAIVLGADDDLVIANEYFDQGLNEPAIELYNQILKHDPANIEAHMKSGIVYLRTGRFSEAESKLRLAVGLDPWSAEACFHLGQALGIQKKYEEALVYFEKAIDLNPDYPSALNGLANIYLEMKMYDKALSSVKKALEMDPGLVVARCTLGEIYDAMGEYEKALDEFEASKDDPGYAAYAKGKIDEIRNKIK